MDRAAWISAAVCILIGVALWAGPAILRPDLFDGDATHHTYWLFRYIDPTLFPGDPSVDYYRTSAPLGYRALYAALCQVVDPILGSKLVSAVLFATSAFLAWQLGASVGFGGTAWRGLAAVLGLILLLAASPQTDSLATMGMQRTFGLPITLLAAWALVSGRHAWLGVSCLLAGLFYPVLLAVIGLGAGLYFTVELVRTRQLPQAWLANAAMGAVAVAAGLWGVPDAGALGPAVTYAEAASMADFGPGGRMDLWSPDEWRTMFWHNMTGLGWPPKVVLLLAACVAFLAWKRRLHEVPAAVWYLVAAGLALWLALRLFPDELMFRLYLPNRHPRWVLAVFGALAFSAVVMVFLQVRKEQPSTSARWRFRAFAAIAPCVTLLALAPQALQQWRTPRDPDRVAMFRFLESLPVSTLVAAHPDEADPIPLYARRSVLASSETLEPFLLGYHAIMKPRIEASLRATYATSIEEVDRELLPYGVDVMVIGPRSWGRQGYFQPFDADVRGLLQRGAQAGFVLRDPPPDRILFRSGAYTVVRIGAAS